MRAHQGDGARRRFYLGMDVLGHVRLRAKTIASGGFRERRGMRPLQSWNARAVTGPMQGPKDAMSQILWESLNALRRRSVC